MKKHIAVALVATFMAISGGAVAQGPTPTAAAPTSGMSFDDARITLEWSRLAPILDRN